MVSTNSIFTTLAYLTSPSQHVGNYSTNKVRGGILTFSAPFSPTFLPLCLRPPANYLPLLVMATVQLCARSLAGVAGIGISPSHVLGLALKV